MFIHRGGKASFFDAVRAGAIDFMLYPNVVYQEHIGFPGARLEQKKERTRCSNRDARRRTPGNEDNSIIRILDKLDEVKREI